MQTATTADARVVQSAQSELDFLVVCDDYPAFRTVTTAVRNINGKLSCAPSPASAKDYIARRKVDGIIVDLRVDGALELIEAVRRGSSNKFSVVFACVTCSSEATQALGAGANFLIHHPLNLAKVDQVFQSAASMMAAEKRRYFRYPLMVPVNLKTTSKETKVTMSNLSEGGMALWCLEPHQLGATVGFSFELPFGGSIQGKGEVAWVSSEGLVGVKFHHLAESAYKHLLAWLNRRMPAA